MKRLIKYWNRYESDGFKFSDCSTQYELMPVLVDDTAGIDELKALAKKHGVKLGRKIFTNDNYEISHSINTLETKEIKEFNSVKKVTVYFGFIKVPNGPLTPKETLDNRVSEKDAIEIVNVQRYGVHDYGQHVDGTWIIVKEGWNYYHDMAIAGYSRESFEKALDAEDYGFSDDTDSCSKCNLFDSRDNGYTYNFRYVEDIGENLGVNCGCYKEFCTSSEAVEVFKDNPNKAMELDAAQALEEAGKLKFVERFIGGMVDGRGGWFAGKPTREGTPKGVFQELKDKNKKKSYVFSHDESGQFQTYFSVWEVLPAKKKKSKRKVA